MSNLKYQILHMLWYQGYIKPNICVMYDEPTHSYTLVQIITAIINNEFYDNCPTYQDVQEKVQELIKDDLVIKNKEKEKYKINEENIDAIKSLLSTYRSEIFV